MAEQTGGDHVIVVGQGYVGLPLAMVAHAAGHTVSGIDTDKTRVGQIASGISPISDVTSSQLSSALSSGRYSISNSYDIVRPFNAAIITVPTPLHNGQPNLRFIESAGAALAPLITPKSLVVLESTTYPGTTEELLVPILESGSGLIAGKDFHVGYSPERIDPGNLDWNLLNTPKVVSGIDNESAEVVSRLYSSFGIPVVPVSGTREAELTKLLENTFRHVNIALVNELAMFSAQLGVDIWEAISAASTKPFGFMSFAPGPGVGGHCLPIDPSYLSWAIKEKSGESFRFVELANTINSYMPTYAAERVLRLLAERNVGPEGSRILLYGLAYKTNTSDTRESPALAIAAQLKALGAVVYAIDEYVDDLNWPSFILRHSADEVNYDIGVVVTPHDEKTLQSITKICTLVLDTRNTISGSNVQKLSE